jgi:hypothetical protein
LKKRVDADHVVFAKRFEEEVNFPLKTILERQHVKKMPNVFNSEILKINWVQMTF